MQKTVKVHEHIITAPVYWTLLKRLQKVTAYLCVHPFTTSLFPLRSQIHFTIAKFDSHYKATSIREQNFRAFALKPLAFIPALGFSS